MKRSEMNKDYFWILKDMYESGESWDKAFKETEKEAKFLQFKGKLGEKKNLLACLRKQDEVSRKIERLFVYAHMLHDQDTSDAQNGTYISRAQGLLVRLNAETAYMLPELTALDESVLKGFIADPDFSDYDYMLETVLKSKAHVLGEEAGKGPRARRRDVCGIPRRFHDGRQRRSAFPDGERRRRQQNQGNARGIFGLHVQPRQGTEKESVQGLL